MEKAFSENAMRKTRVREWYKRNQEGREDPEDDKRTAHQEPTKTWKKLRKRETAEKIDMLYESDGKRFLRGISRK